MENKRRRLDGEWRKMNFLILMNILCHLIFFIGILLLTMFLLLLFSIQIYLLNTYWFSLLIIIILLVYYYIKNKNSRKNRFFLYFLSLVNILTLYGFGTFCKGVDMAIINFGKFCLNLDFFTEIKSHKNNMLYCIFAIISFLMIEFAFILKNKVNNTNT